MNMYYSVTGNAEARDNFLVVYAGGVGYKIFSSNTTIANIRKDREFTVYTYLNVREDALDLYGFSTEEELSTFKMLISVSGVGPKAALAILSALAPAEFAVAVVTNDPKTLTAAQGVGKRLAEKIIVELKDKLRGASLDDMAGDSGTGPNLVAAGITEEAVNALIVLGYSAYEARRAVKASESESGNLEDLIKAALKKLIKG
jgi:Holliday junction DNA helicase RuvA